MNIFRIERSSGYINRLIANFKMAKMFFFFDKYLGLHALHPYDLKSQEFAWFQCRPMLHTWTPCDLSEMAGVKNMYFNGITLNSSMCPFLPWFTTCMLCAVLWPPREIGEGLASILSAALSEQHLRGLWEGAGLPCGFGAGPQQHTHIHSLPACRHWGPSIWISIWPPLSQLHWCLLAG